MSAKSGDASEPAGRVATLDGVRGVAIALVLWLHCFTVLPDSWLATVVNHIARIGWLGVDLFFVLSGYLITGILLRSRESPSYFRHFYLRRTLRIFPAYYLVLFAAFVLVPLFHAPARESNLREYTPYFLVYVQNWVNALDRSAFGWPGVDHLWSLAIEEQFYLIWPLVVSLAPLPVLRRICIWVIVLSIAGKFLLWVAHASWVTIYMSTVTRLDGLAAGALVATLPRVPLPQVMTAARAVAWPGALVLALLVVVGATLFSAPMIVVATTAASGAFGGLLFALHTGRLPRWGVSVLEWGALRWLGRYSYGIYLWHYVVYWPVVVWAGELFPGIGHRESNFEIVFTGAVTLGLTLLLAVPMYHAFEAPLLRLRSRFEPEPSVRPR